MSLEEKIGQMVQLSGEFFNNDDNVVTGPRKNWEFPRNKSSWLDLF